ncbi:hypothetical protein [Paraburkholderia sacchari]|uniref:hypothetical protein n=1 Tax=Paraburkholderia sacchari TaxID=159450 RepID=UPI0039A6A09E
MADRHAANALRRIAVGGDGAGGTALMRVAAARPEPIPVYAEMSSITWKAAGVGEMR